MAGARKVARTRILVAVAGGLLLILILLILAMPPRPVTLRGQISGKRGLCTKQVCPPDRPCCQTCDGEPALFAGTTSQLLALPGVSCHGNGCVIPCEGMDPAATYEVEGTLGEPDEDGLRRLVVTRLAKLP